MDDRDKSDGRTRDRHSERDHRHHRSRHDSDDHRHHRSDRNAKHELKTREDREGSRDRVYDRDEREGSKGRSKVKRDEEREDSVEPRHSHSHKRKDREHSEDRDLEDKRIRVSEEKREVKKERRKFGDKVKKDEDYDIEPKINDEVTNGAHGAASSKDNASALNGVAVGSPAVVRASVPETSLPPPPPFPIKMGLLQLLENLEASLLMP
ncbi:hypothetical protein RYX36_017587 [Vicia faba]